MQTSPNRPRDYDRIQHFSQVSLAERLHTIYRSDQESSFDADPDFQERMQLNPQHNRDGQAAFESVPLTEYQVSEEEEELLIPSRPEEERRDWRLLRAISLFLLLSLAVLLPPLLLQPSSWCGNGVAEPGEPCDDGNADDADGCARNCTIVPGFECWCGRDGRCATAPPAAGSRSLAGGRPEACIHPVLSVCPPLETAQFSSPLNEDQVRALAGKKIHPGITEIVLES